MIPNFPKFKKLELSDRVYIEEITKQFPPYSDFNFTSMWSWDIWGKILISEFNDNLVVRFTNYLTGEPFYSFLGNNKVTETACQLIDFVSKTSLLSQELRLIPQEQIIFIDNKNFLIREDIDDNDYIINICMLSEYKGKIFSRQRNLVNKFKNSFDVSSRVLDLNNAICQQAIKQLFREIMQKKYANHSLSTPELRAIYRFFTIRNFSNIVGVGSYVGGKLVGITIGEMLHNRFIIGHFCKADIDLSNGLYAFLIQETAKFFRNLDYELINIEQDLGLVNLRQFKQSYRPQSFLKKFTIISKGKNMQKWGILGEI